jgi:hypothetical protein
VWKAGAAWYAGNRRWWIAREYCTRLVSDKEDKMAFRRVVMAITIVLAFIIPLGCRGIRSIDYFPAELGQRWRYHLDVDGYESEVTVEVTEKAGGSRVLRSTLDSGEDEMNFPYPVGENTDITISDTAVTGENTRPFVLLRFPLAEGMSWPAFRSDTATVLGKVSVTVTAGDFDDCYKVGYGRVGSYYEYVIWFAPKVGIVKIAEDEDYIWELTSTNS